MSTSIRSRTVSRLFFGDTRGFALTLALLFGAVTVGSNALSLVQNGHSGAAAKASTQVVDSACDDGLLETDEQPWIRTELFFGTAKPDGSVVSESDWREFLDREITERFPDGLTVLTGNGQWQESDDEIVKERSIIVILLYPRDAAIESGTKIEQIRFAYEQQFQQESVLRADDSRPVCTSF
jgi:hypothetical protein